MIGIVNQVNESGDGALSFLELILVFLGRAVLLVLEEWVDELDELINSL